MNAATHENHPPAQPAMRIRYMSDLHLEKTDYDPAELPSVGEDLVILAGDIGAGTDGIRWGRRAFGDRPVIYVLGNHEYYRHDWLTFIDEARAVATDHDVTLLENDAVTFGGLIILGCSLWTDFVLPGLELGEATFASESRVPDYRAISCGDRLLRVADTVERHHASARWLRDALDSADEKCLVVTHHAPSHRHANPRFDVMPYGGVFCSDVDQTMDGNKVHAWIFGHTHYNGTFRSGRTDVPFTACANQRGYPREDTGFDWGRCLELAA